MTFQFLAEQLRARPHEALQLDRPLAVEELATPALLLDRPALIRNIARMREHVAQHGKGFRPHAKTHKCPLISKLQLEAGAVGICVAKVSEAVALVAAGIVDVLITSPLTVPTKIDMVVELMSRCNGRLTLVVDSHTGVDLLVRKLQNWEGDPLNILIDLDVEMGRTGVQENALVQALHEKVSHCNGLRFAGFQHYAGHVMHIEGHAARREKSLSLWHQIESRIADLGVDFDILTGAGTGTYDIDVAVDGLTDLQVGSFVFMDEEYRRIGGQNNERFVDFEVSLHLAATTISQPRDGAITVDAGFKSMASDTVPAAVDELANTKFRFAGDEHGVLISKESMQGLQLGDVVKLVTPHCDPTVNLHDYYWIVEDDGLIHAAWPITARGCTW